MTMRDSGSPPRAVRNDVGMSNAIASRSPLRGRVREGVKAQALRWWPAPLSTSPPQGGKEPSITVVNAYISIVKLITSPVRRVELDRFRKLPLPAVAIGEKFLLVIIEFLARLGGKFEIRPLDDGIDRTGLLAQAAIDALHHIDVVSHGATGGVVAARPRLY